MLSEMSQKKLDIPTSASSEVTRHLCVNTTFCLCALLQFLPATPSSKPEMRSWARATRQRWPALPWAASPPPPSDGWREIKSFQVCSSQLSWHFLPPANTWVKIHLCMCVGRLVAEGCLDKDLTIRFIQKTLWDDMKVKHVGMKAGVWTKGQHSLLSIWMSHNILFYIIYLCESIQRRSHVRLLYRGAKQLSSFSPVVTQFSPAELWRV